MNYRYNTYYKGGENDDFMSGLWIGSAIVADTIFICCRFNYVDAEFRNCVFIDCDNPPEGENCIYGDLPDNIRLRPQVKDDAGEWH